MTSNCVLIIDTREGKVLSHTTELNQITWEKKQITTGDYALYKGQSLLAVFERKSLEDYGASIKDGRANNKDKMLAMRAKTGCRVFYIIEGPKSPSRDTKFARIPFGCIQASIDHLMLRDGIMVIWTLNTLDTAKRLVDFVKNADTLMAKIGDDTFLQQRVTEGGSIATPLCDDNNATEGVRCGENTFSLDELTAPIKKSDQDVVREMWASFKGITVENADSFIDKWTLADIVQKKIPRAELEAHKLPNRRLVSKNIVNALLTTGPVIDSRLLSKVPQISARTANDLLRGRSLASIVSTSEDVLSIYTFGKLNTKIGKARAGNIVRLFHYRAGATVVAAHPVAQGRTMLENAPEPAEDTDDVVDTEEAPVSTTSSAPATTSVAPARLHDSNCAGKKPAVVRRIKVPQKR